MQPGKRGSKLAVAPLLYCFLDKHDPDRGSALWDGTHYIGHCIQCGKKIRRKASKDWRKDWLGDQRKTANPPTVRPPAFNGTHSSG